MWEALEGGERVDIESLLKDAPFDMGIVMGSKCQELFDVECRKHVGVMIIRKAHHAGCDHPDKESCFRFFMQSIAHDCKFTPSQFTDVMNSFLKGEGASNDDIIKGLDEIVLFATGGRVNLSGGVGKELLPKEVQSDLLRMFDLPPLDPDSPPFTVGPFKF